MSNNPYSPFLNAWTRTSSQFLAGVLEANKAAITAFSPATKANKQTGLGEGKRVEDRIEATADLPEWDAVVSVSDPPTTGDSIQFTKTLTEADVARFAAASGDTNPLHIDEDAAKETRFNGRIVHGILASGLISAAIARLPGTAVYLSQEVEFLAPVRIGDRITADCEIVEELGGGRFRIRTTVENGEETAIAGEAVVLLED